MNKNFVYYIEKEKRKDMTRIILKNFLEKY